MFLWIKNENRVKRRIRYTHYLLKNTYFGKLKKKLKRVKFEGFSLSFPFGFSANFRMVPKPEGSQNTHEPIIPINHKLTVPECHLNIPCYAPEHNRIIELEQIPYAKRIEGFLKEA